MTHLLASDLYCMYILLGLIAYIQYNTKSNNAVTAKGS